MRTALTSLPLRLVMVAMLLLVTAVAPAPAQARHDRSPRAKALEGLLLDLARLEVFNVELEDETTERAVQGQIDVVRRGFLGVVEGVQSPVVALRTTQRALQYIAYQIANSYYDDEDVLRRMDTQLQRLGYRTDQILAALGRPGADPYYIPPPPAGFYPGQWPSSPQDYHPGWRRQQGWQQPQQQAYPPRRMPMSAQRFAALLASVRQESFANSQLRIVQDAARSGNSFTCDQIAQLMRSVSFSATQVQIAAALYPQVVDPESFNLLTSALTFEADRQKLRQLVGR